MTGSELVDPDEGTETSGSGKAGDPSTGSELVDPDEGTETWSTTLTMVGAAMF